MLIFFMLFILESTNLTYVFDNLIKQHLYRGLSPDPPSPTTTSKTTDPNPTGPTDDPVTTSSDNPPEICCTSVEFESTGLIGTSKPDHLGSYRSGNLAVSLRLFRDLLFEYHRAVVPFC